MADWLLLSGAALLGSSLAGVTGFGGAAILLPPLVHLYGVKVAIPILTIAQLFGNGSRVYFHRDQINWKVVGYFSIAAIPSAFIGGHFFSRAPAPLLMRFLGGFLLAIVAWRWTSARWISVGKSRNFPAKGFIGVGAVFSFLSALVGSVGPFIVPFFLMFGLIKSAFISTEALCTVIMHIVKLVAYHQTSILTSTSILTGLALGPLMIMGSWFGKKIVHRISDKIFVVLVELTLIFAGLNFLIRG